LGIHAANKDMATKLIFDIIITGHHSEYIGHLVDYLVKNPDDHHYIFVTHPDFPSRFPNIISKAKENDNIQISGITAKELRMSESGNLLKRSFSWYKIVAKYASQYNANHALLLYFNLFQLPLIFFRPKFHVSGILFLQFYRMAKTSWKERLKYFRKYCVTKSFSLNPKIHKIFILNDNKTAEFLNNEFRTKIFHVLYDPVPYLRPAEGFNSYDHYNIEPDRKILLHLGALSDRKGTLEFIESALSIKHEFQSGLAFLVAGSPGSAEMSEKIETRINQVNKTTKIKAVYDNGFLSNEKMKSIVDQCYAIVIPYKNPEASSGILGHAAASNKPVITTGKGLLKELIEHYNLGLLIDEVTPEFIAEKIETLLGYDDWKSESLKFIMERTPENFASTIVTQKG